MTVWYARKTPGTEAVINGSIMTSDGVVMIEVPGSSRCCANRRVSEALS